MNKNSIELLGYYGGDSTHAQSAWTSTKRDLTADKIARIPTMLSDLAKNGHHTPFEKSSLHFLVDTDVASHIHIIKHRIGVSVNGESARYKELKEDKFYLPKDWKDAGPTGVMWYARLEEFTQQSNNLYHQALKALEPALGRKRAKESARYFKTYNSQTSADVMFNFRSFMHFLGLRKKTTAQLEIHDIAAQMLQLVKDIEGNPFEHSIKAFGY